MRKPGRARRGRRKAAAPAARVARFGAMVRAARLALGLSQEELGRRVGVVASAISRYEAGTMEPPRETVNRLIKVLNLDEAEALRALGYELSRPRTLVEALQAYGLDLPHAVAVALALDQRAGELLREISRVLGLEPPSPPPPSPAEEGPPAGPPP